MVRKAITTIELMNLDEIMIGYAYLIRVHSLSDPAQFLPLCHSTLSPFPKEHPELSLSIAPPDLALKARIDVNWSLVGFRTQKEFCGKTGRKLC